MLRVFAYGSLIFSPELPERVLHRQPARLPGHRRAFNKRSGPRACPAEHRAFPELEDTLPERFRAPTTLALGTAVGGSMDGVVLTYPDEVRDEVLARLDAREGVLRDQAQRAWSYLPEAVSVDTADGARRAIAWLSNPGGEWHEEGLESTLVARILLHATPHAVGEYAYGADYLLQTWQALAGIGVRDGHLEELVAALPKPWIRGRLGSG